MTARCKNCPRVIQSCECSDEPCWRHVSGAHQCPSGWTDTTPVTYAEPKPGTQTMVDA